MSDFIYDIETYPNIFSMVVASDEQRKIWTFEVSDRKNDYQKIRQFIVELRKNGDRMVGFNNVGFDYPVLNYYLRRKGEADEKEVYNFAMEIIEGMRKDDKFRFIVRPKDEIVKQVDLFKIHHYDNKAKATSLKMVEFNMRSENIEDLPFPPGTVLTHKQMDTLLQYNRHDVLETLKFYRLSKNAIEFREVLGEKYGKDFINFNDTKIGKDFFVSRLEENMPGSCYEYDPVSKRNKVKQTKRNTIPVKGILFDYVKFERPEFQAVKDWFEKQVIRETKGVFTDIDEANLGNLAQYARLVEKKKKLKMIGFASKDETKVLKQKMKEETCEETIEKIRDEICGKPSQNEIDKLYVEHPKGWVERQVLKSGSTSYYFKWRIAESLNTIVDGLEYVFGLGGIHASVDGSTYISDDEYVILDFDYASMYPNIFISNRIYPEHLGEQFCDIYEDLYTERKSHPKGTPENAVMKLALNGTYGGTNDKFSPFYDPKVTMQVTINGQLTLCGLAEKLLKVENLSIIQCNTDGLTVYCKRKDEKLIDSIVKEWDQIVGLEMEKVEYDRMAIANVNNYLSLYTDGKVKRNGAYQYEGLGFHQNQSTLVVKMAAEKSILHDIPVEKTVREHKEKMDFMLRTKVPRSSRLVRVDEEGIEYPEQNICRYYIANDGMKLVKVMPPLPGKEEKGERYIGIDKEWLVKTCNNIKDFDGDINYDYYIREAKKLVEGVGKKVI